MVYKKFDPWEDWDGDYVYDHQTHTMMPPDMYEELQKQRKQEGIENGIQHSICG